MGCGQAAPPVPVLKRPSARTESEPGGSIRLGLRTCEKLLARAHAFHSPWPLQPIWPYVCEAQSGSVSLTEQDVASAVFSVPGCENPLFHLAHQASTAGKPKSRPVFCPI